MLFVVIIYLAKMSLEAFIFLFQRRFNSFFMQSPSYALDYPMESYKIDVKLGNTIGSKVRQLFDDLLLSLYTSPVVL